MSQTRKEMVDQIRQQNNYFLEKEVEMNNLIKDKNQIEGLLNQANSQIQLLRSQAVRSFDENQLANEHIKYLTTRIKFLEKYQRI